MTDKKKQNFSKRFSQFLTKLFWHLHHQPTPTYSSIIIHPKCSKSSMKKNLSKLSTYKKSSIDRYYVRSQYPAVYRTCCIRERTSTLSSIQEE